MVEVVVEISGVEEGAGMKCAEGMTMLGAEQWARERPDVHLVRVRDGLGAARCSLWTEGTPTLDGAAVAVVGHYAAVDQAAGAGVLARACAVAAERGRGVVVGPMDGSTWRRYRLVTERGTEPPFFMEPDNPDDWPGHFAAAGFEPLARYFSALCGDLTVRDERVPEALRRLEGAGVRLRNIDLGRFEAELAAVHELSVAAFANNFLSTPIGREAFLEMYLPLRGLIQPELVLLAERDGRLEGFMFGVPDALEARRAGAARTAIAKSMAVRPGRGGAGLGSVLMDRFHAAAAACGYERVIHALMHESNTSLRMSARYGKPMRQYTLYQRRTP